MPPCQGCGGVGSKKEIRSCYQHFVFKMQERSPLKYPITKYLSFLDPSNICNHQVKSGQNVTKALEYMVDRKIISPATADRADREFKELCTNPTFGIQCDNFTKPESRLDQGDKCWWNRKH